MIGHCAVADAPAMTTLVITAYIHLVIAKPSPAEFERADYYMFSTPINDEQASRCRDVVHTGH